MTEKHILLFVALATLFLICVPTSTYADTTGLVLLFPFDEGSGTVAYDYSGYENEGTIYNGTWVDGVEGYALEFDGVNGSVQALNDASLSCSVVTVAAWVYLNKETASNWGMVLTKGDQNTEGYRLRWYETNQSKMFFGIYAGGAKRETDIFEVTVGEWHHLVGVFDGTQLRLYVNGSLASGATSYTGEITTGSGNMYVGSHTNTSKCLDGVVDDVRVYNRALSASEIAELAGATTDADADIYDVMFDELYAGDFVGFVLAPYLNLIGNLFYGLVMLIICIPIYNRSKSITPILILFIIFGGGTGIFSLLVPEVGLQLGWILLLLGLGGLLYKVFR